MTLEQLETEGYVVKFTHLRSFFLPTQGIFEGRRHEHPALRPLARGGFTICTVFWNGEYVLQGTASCSTQDNYCKKLGRDIALGRAVAELSGEADLRKSRKFREENNNVAI